jgi:tetratricopeptide (TPR) repeat protein
MNNRPEAGHSRLNLKRALWITGGLLVLFYGAVLLIPPVARVLLSQSLYNYRYIAREAEAAGEYDRAVAVLEEAAAKIPREVYFERPEFIYDWIGRILRKQGKVRESLEAFLRAQKGYFVNIRLRGYYPPLELIRNILEGYFETGNPEGAFQEASVAMDWYPTQRDELIRTHREYAPTDPRILRDTGVLELKTRRRATGRENLKKASTRSPALPETNFWLGALAESEGRDRVAIEAYEREIENNPFSDNAARRLAALYGPSQTERAKLFQRRDALNKARVTTFAKSGSELALLTGIASQTSHTFTLESATSVVVNVTASSTPFDGMWGWVEILLDGRHLQTLYIGGNFLLPNNRHPMTYSIRLDELEAGKHTLTIRNLSDAGDEHADRNSVIHKIDIYRAPRS